MLVRIIKDWAWPNLLRQTPQGDGRWADLQFTVDPVVDCDYVLFLNNRRNETVTVHCSEEHIGCVMQEPYIPILHDWMIKDLPWCARVYSHTPVQPVNRFVKSHPALPWHVNRDYAELVTLAPVRKERLLSWVTSRLSFLPMHRKRIHFLRRLQTDQTPIDLYGKGIRYIDDKWDGLAPYYYSVVIENDRQPDYWSEKLADCFLSWTVPLYDGCLNLEDYFPSDSFIRIDADSYESSLEVIRRTATPSDWQRRLPALEEARNRVLQRWQFFPYFYEQLGCLPPAGAKKRITIPDNRSLRRADRRRFLLQHIAAQGPKAAGRLLMDKFNYIRWERHT